jgi:hypothetical protein
MISLNNINLTNVRRSKLNGGIVKSAKDKSLVTKQQVRSMILSSIEQVRPKYLVSSLLNNIIVTSTQTITPGLPPQGVSNNQREGDSIEIEALDIRFDCSSSNNLNAFRLVCVQAIGSHTPTASYSSAPLTGVLDNGPSGAVDPMSTINMYGNGSTFHVLHDELILPPITQRAAYAVRVKPKIEKVDFAIATTAPLNGGITYFLMCWGSTATVNFSQRLVYRDL